jgi:F0F1-type ATP synthase assembly protein I
MNGIKKSNIWLGCTIIGVAVGFLLSQFWGYGAGMPIGVLLGLGTAFLLTSIQKD